MSAFYRYERLSDSLAAMVWLNREARVRHLPHGMSEAAGAALAMRELCTS